MKLNFISTNPFDDWFLEEKGSGGDFELETNVDECLSDDYDEESK